MNEMIAFIALVVALTALGVIGLMIRMVRKLRSSVVTAINETAEQNIKTATKLADAIAALQKQQKTYEQQLLAMAQAGQKLRQDINLVAQHIQNDNEAEAKNKAPSPSRLLH